MELTMTNGFNEMNEMEMREVEGGMTFLENLGLVWVLYEAGYAIGKMIYHVTH